MHPHVQEVNARIPPIFAGWAQIGTTPRPRSSFRTSARRHSTKTTCICFFLFGSHRMYKTGLGACAVADLHWMSGVPTEYFHDGGDEVKCWCSEDPTRDRRPDSG